MFFQTQLRVPGPTPLPERVVRAQSMPMVDHRGPEFAALLKEITEGAKRVFKTSNDLLFLTCSGTGGLESAICNLVSPGDKVVAALCGNFGERFADIAEVYGAHVTRLTAEWGQPVEPAELRRVLQENPGTEIVLLTHNETSTGLTNDLPALAKVAREAGCLVVVDGVSSVSSIAVDNDGWGIDVFVSGSQKGWMAPPGIAIVTVSSRAWEKAAGAKAPRFYLDWAEAKKQAEQGMTPFTPAVGVLYAMREGLRMLEEEGLEAAYERHDRLAKATQAGLEALGFTLFAAAGHRSNTVTSAVAPAAIDADKLRKLLRQKYGVVLGGGQGKMKGKLVRVGHLGAVAEGDIVQVLWAIEQALEELDVAPAAGRGVAAASQVLAKVSTAA